MSLHPRLLDLIVRYEEAREQGRPVTPEELCRSCPELLEELRRNLQGLEAVDQMVEAQPQEPSGFLRTVPAPVERSTPTPGQLPTVEGFELLEALGSGGMGVVYKARQLRLNRVVALKMILSGAHATPEERRRFRQEAEVIARLRHPNIVQIYEFGEQNGVPYLVLEYVNGGSLAARLGRKPQPPAEAAQAVETLARAAHAAHLQGVIHRDLKPVNILLSHPDSQSTNSGHWPELKITDFGLAKRLDASVARTRSGDMMGTPSYMAPEQASGRNKEIGPATDVHALGIILYEMLTGRPPFRGDSHYEIVRHVLEEDATPFSRLRLPVPRDLEVICLKCLEKQPARRYASALDLAEDLRRFRAGEPIWARRTSPWERAVKWVQRRPAMALAVLAAVILFAFLGAIVNGLQLRSALDRLAVAQAEIKLSQRQHQYAQDLRAAALFWRNNDVPEMQRLLERYRTAEPGEADLRGFEWGYLTRLAEHGQRTTLHAHEGPVLWAAYTPDGKWLASCGEDATVRLWDTSTWQIVATLRGHRGAVLWAAFLDSQTLLTAGQDRTVRKWEAAQKWQTTAQQTLEAVPTLLALASNGRLLAVVFERQRLRVVNLVDQKLSPPMELAGGDQFEAITFTPDSQHVATLMENGIWHLVDPRTGKAVTHGHTTGNTGLAWAADGRTLVHAGQEGRYTLLSCSGRIAADRLVTDAMQVYSCREYHGPLRLPAFSPEGRLLALAGEDDTIHVEVVAYPHLGFTLRGHTDRLTCLTFAPDSSLLISTSRDGTIRRWETRRRQEYQSAAFDADVVGPLAYSPDGKILAAATREREVVLLELATGRIRARLRGHAGDLRALAFSPQGDLLATAGQEGTARLWDTVTGQPRALLPHNRESVEAIAFSLNGQLLATAGRDGNVRLWDLPEGRARHVLPTRAGVPRSLSFSSDGTLLAAACEGSKEIRLWEPATGKEAATLVDEHALHTVCFSRRGLRLAAARENADVSVWDVGARKRLGVASAGSALLCLTFSADDRFCYVANGGYLRWFDLDSLRIQKSVSLYNRVMHATVRPDGGQLATVDCRGRLHLIDPATWSLHVPVAQPPTAVHSLCFNSKGTQLVTAGSNNAAVVRLEFLFNIDRSMNWAMGEDIQCWDTATGNPHRTPLRDRTASGFRAATLSADGRLLAAGIADGNVGLWDYQTGERLHLMSLGKRSRLLAKAGEFLATGQAVWPLGTLGQDRHRNAVRVLAFSPDGRTLAAAEAMGTIKLFALPTGVELATLPEVHEAVQCLSFSPDSSTLAVNHRNAVHLWDVRTRTKLRTLTGHRETVWSVAYRADGQLLATGGQDARIRLWNPATGEVLDSLAGHQDTVSSLAFSPHDNGRTLASSSWDSKVKLWHGATRTEILTLDAHVGRVNALAFTPNGQVLATGGETTTGAGEIHFWKSALHAAQGPSLLK